MLKQLLQNLNSKDESVREAALREARALPPEQLLQLLQTERHASRRAISPIKMSLLMAQIAALILFLFVSSGRAGRYTLPLVGSISILWVLGGTGLALYSSEKHRHVRQSIIRLLEELDDERSVPAALFMLRSPEYLAQRENLTSLLNVLKKALPRLRHGQADCWKPEQMRALLSLLDHPEDDIELTLSVLKALEQIGDKRALPRVRFLAEDDYMADDTDARLSEYLGTVSGSRTQVRERSIRRTRVQKAAQECLPYLEARCAEKQQAQTLLRASSVSGVAQAETLLRPANPAAGTTPTEQLLRPNLPSSPGPFAQ